MQIGRARANLGLFPGGMILLGPSNRRRVSHSFPMVTTDRNPRNGSGRFPSILILLALFAVGAVGGALVSYLRTPAEDVTGRGEAGESTPASADHDHQPGEAMPLPEETDSPERRTRVDLIHEAGGEIMLSRGNAISRAAHAAAPAVVTVGVTKTRLVRGQRAPLDPFELFFNRYLPGVVYEQKIPGIGSGLIVDPTGIVLTNEHVVRDAREIKIILNDGRTLEARLVGADPNYDLAVLKVDADDLPSIALGNSDDLTVGEWAIAIGSPFGFYLNDAQPTVTVGVISALHRDVKPDGETTAIYKDMIQTDAAINPGNSGGPLLNALGEVIGINTFIFTQGGGSLGIGFAIPINTAVRVAREIIKYGRARPVWIGVYAQQISPWIAGQLGLRDPRGLLVSRIEGGSPADRADLRVMDIIRAVNGRPVSSAQEATRTIFGAQVGDVLTFAVERQGEIHEIPVTVEAAPTGQ